MLASEKVHFMEGRDYSCNTILIEAKDDWIMVDPGLPSETGRVQQAIEDAGAEPEDIRRIINTHCHFDHIGADHFFQQNWSCRVFLYVDDAQPVRAGDGLTTCAEPFGEELKPIGVDGGFENGDRVEGTDFEVIHTPGHTHGSMCLYDKTNRILISGDTVFMGGVGRTDLPTGSEEELYQSLKKLAKLDIDILLPGHGDFAAQGGKKYVESALAALSRRKV